MRWEACAWVKIPKHRSLINGTGSMPAKRFRHRRHMYDVCWKSKSLSYIYGVDCASGKFCRGRNEKGKLIIVQPGLLRNCAFATSTESDSCVKHLLSLSQQILIALVYTYIHAIRNSIYEIRNCSRSWRFSTQRVF